MKRTADCVCTPRNTLLIKKGDEASKTHVATLEIGCPVTVVCWSANGPNVYVGAINNETYVRVFIPLLSMVIENYVRFTTYAKKKYAF